MNHTRATNMQLAHLRWLPHTQNGVENKMDKYPDLAGVATANLVEKIVGKKFQASYINWSRTMELLRKNALGGCRN